MPNALLIFKKELPRGHFCVYQSRPEFDFTSVKQTHSSIVQNQHDVQKADLPKEADGMVGSSVVPMAILTADCLPILLLGKNDHAFVHAGWRGLQKEILSHNLIQKIGPQYVFIGPHISVNYYEVQPDFRDNFKNISTDSKVFIEKEGKIFFNLAIVARLQLESLYPGIKIEDSGSCTFQDERFHSYRRNKTLERNWNIYIP